MFAGVASADETDPEDNDVEDEPDVVVAVGADDELAFEPAQLPLSTGETVEFEWEGDGHNLAVTYQPDDADWDGEEEVQDAGHMHTHTFDIEGWYEYVCEPHEDEEMIGTILVCDIERPDVEEEEAEDDDVGY